MNLPAVFTVSLAALCYEVLLTRFFAFSQWNHLSFMVISIVMFGFAASGSVLSLVERRRPGWTASMLNVHKTLQMLVLCSLAISASFLLVKNIPLDYFRMPLEWPQGAYLFFTFLILLVPFFCAGSVISVAFAGMSIQAGWIYFANMFGSAVGAVLPAILLPLLGEGRIVYGCALLLLVVCFVHALRHLRSEEQGKGSEEHELSRTVTVTRFIHERPPDAALARTCPFGATTPTTPARRPLSLQESVAGLGRF